jgi:glyoxylase-like metal-dependent hydrolase (beta-lactamase superfamily II)
VGTLKIKVLPTPGLACFPVGGRPLTGDTLFVGAAGRTDLTGASLDTLIASIKNKILSLRKKTVIWPGHDYGETPSSTLERELICGI